MKPTLLILVGPSAVGKTTVAERIVKDHPTFSPIRSLTTRPPRGDEHDDEYLYTDKDGFEQALARGEILEHTLYADTLYGTPRSEIDRVVSLGKTPLLVLDINGAESLSKRADTLSPCIIYLTESEQVLNRRLAERYLSGEGCDRERYDARIRRNGWEREHFPEFSHLFYDVIEGKSTPSDTALAVIKSFESFKNAN